MTLMMTLMIDMKIQLMEISLKTQEANKIIVKI